MSAAVIRYTLVQSAALLAVVPSARIRLGVLPVGQALPAIGVVSVSGVPHNALGAGGGRRWVRERIQVTAYAQTYPQLDQLMGLIDQSVPRSRSTIAGLDVQAILPGPVGPDLESLDPHIFMRSRDFFVTYLR